jgi:hypothetical protein
VDLAASGHDGHGPSVQIIGTGFNRIVENPSEFQFILSVPRPANTEGRTKVDSGALSKDVDHFNEIRRSSDENIDRHGISAITTQVDIALLNHFVCIRHRVAALNRQRPGIASETRMNESSSLKSQRAICSRTITIDMTRSIASHRRLPEPPLIPRAPIHPLARPIKSSESPDTKSPKTMMSDS